MAKKGKKAARDRKTIKIEIPVPPMPHPDTRKAKKFLKEHIPTSEDISKVGKEVREHVPRSVSSRKVKKFVRDYDKYLAAAVIVVVAIAAVSLYLVYYQPGGFEMPGIAGPRTVQVTVPANISLTDFIANYLAYADRETTLTGHLLLRVEQASPTGTMTVHVYYIVDDFGNQIHLTAILEGQKAYFIREQVTEGVYNVTGKVRAKYGGFDFEIKDIVPVPTPMTVVERQV